MSARRRAAPVHDDLFEPRGFWDRYSPNGELAWSSAMSFGLFCFLVLLPVVLVTPFASRDPAPPAVDVLVVGEDENAPDEEGDDFASEAAMGTDEASPQDVPDEAVVGELDEVDQPELPAPDVVPVERGTELAEETAVAESALDRLTQARAQLDANLKQGEASGGGSGGSGTRGRGARVARWVLHFNTRSPRHYLMQLDGLGAQIAFPEVGNRWRYYFEVSGKKPRSEVRDLAGEQRVYWVDEKPESIGGVAGELGIAVPPFMIVFLPVAMEERMLRMELAYQNLAEDEIRRTDFEVVTRGGQYDVRVTRQIKK
jgi:hypothetical protein